jgi:hypothetical protein
MTRYYYLLCVRCGAGSIYAQCEGSKEVYVKGQRARVTAGIPSRRDVDFCMQLARKAAIAQHSHTGSSTRINSHSVHEQDDISSSFIVVGDRH